MDKQISEKLDALLKYVPFIDFIVSMDNGKYVKFINIKKWIVSKKRYPLSDLNKIEQSIITQYKNLMVLDDKKIPDEISKIFSDDIQQQCINLCSDDEESDTIIIHNGLSEKQDVSISTPKTQMIQSNSKLTRSKEKSRFYPKENVESGNRTLNDISAELLRQIDQVSEMSKSRKDKAFVRRSSVNLSKRSDELQKNLKPNNIADYKNNETKCVMKKQNRRLNKVSTSAVIDTISLDSSDEEPTPITTVTRKETLGVGGISKDNKLCNKNKVTKSNMHSAAVSNNKDKNTKNCNLEKKKKANKHKDSSTPNFKDKSNKESNTQNNSSDISNIRNLNLESLLGKLINIDINKNTDSEDLMQKSIQIDQQCPSSAEECNPTKSKTKAASHKTATINRKPTLNKNVVLQETQHKSPLNQHLQQKLHDPRIRNLFIKFKNSPLLTAEEREMANNLASLMSQVNKICETNQALLGNDLSGDSHLLQHAQSKSVIQSSVEDNQILSGPQNQIQSKPETPEISSATKLMTKADERVGAKEQKQKEKNEESTKRQGTFEVKEMRGILMNTDKTRSILLSTLQPYEAEIASMWQLHKKPNITATALANENVGKENATIVVDQNADSITPNNEKDKDCSSLKAGKKDNIVIEESNKANKEDNHVNKANNFKESSKKSRVDRESSKKSNEEKNKIDPINRIFKELECTIKGYDKLQNHTPRTIGNKRRSTVHARTAIAEQLNSHPVNNTENSSSPTLKQSSIKYKRGSGDSLDGTAHTTLQLLTPHIIERKRRSSVYARTATSEQLKSKPGNCTDNTDITSSTFKRKKAIDEFSKSVEEIPPVSVDSLSNMDDILNTPTARSCVSRNILRISDSDSVIDIDVDSITPNQEKDKDCSTLQAREVLNKFTEKEDLNKGHNKCSKANVYEEGSRNSCREKETSKKTNEEKNKIDQLNRVLKELECSFKGYDKLQIYTPQTIGNKRRSSVYARTAIAEQFNVQPVDTTEINSSPTLAESSLSNKRVPADNSLNDIGSTNLQSLAPRFIQRKRRSSVYARTAIAEQLNSEPGDSMDYSDITSSTSKRRKTIDELSTSEEKEKRPSSVSSLSAMSEKFNDASSCDDIQNTPSARSCTFKNIMRIYDSDSESELNDFEKFRIAKEERLKKSIMQNQPRVVLTRLSADEIKKHAKQSDTLKENCNESYNILDIHLVESRNQPDITTYTAETSPCSKICPPKKLNNDCEMTENNTEFCTLCSSRPSNLTNHYIRKHKSESYVSRLTWTQLEELSLNTPFAKLLPTTDGQSTHYAVTCPFCEKELVEPFMSLYTHFSTHTGEYAFQCSGCQLEKPFKSDIQTHQLNSKNCRTTRIQTMYCYPPNAMVIYLHSCTICHFVQLNEANVLRHLRDHHSHRQAHAHNVKKIILVATNDGPDTDKDFTQASKDSNIQTPKIHSNITQNIQEIESAPKDRLNDDDIPVRNEACAEEMMDSATNALEEQLQQMHEEKPNVVDLEPEAITITPPRFASRHIPNNISPKLIEFSDYCLTPPRPSLHKLTANHSTTKSTYRLYPSNVKYLGLYKCMADDCYFSTNSSNEMLKHLEDHGNDNLSSEYLHCAYCNTFEDTCTSPQQLVDHIAEKHLHMIYQCSMCCYRSCDASNVSVHQEEIHSGTSQACSVYKVHGDPRLCTTEHFNEKIAQNVRKLQCKYCSHNSFYHSNLLEHHMKTDHKVHVRESLKNYSCIYCPLTDNDDSVIRKHLALKHPEELPYVCSHNNPVSKTADLLLNLQVYNIAQTVPVIEMDAIDSVAAEKSSQFAEDVKPNAEQLLQGQEETVKVRLRKLTEETGVAPDTLFRCPEPTCGGFFSIYDLWLRHMRSKHNLCECLCPHCPIETRSLTFYKEHFEEHRRHTYVCYHCPWTFGNVEDAREHASTAHVALGSIRFEQIRFNLSFSYFVLIQTDMLTNRAEFIAELLNVLNGRLRELEISESKNLKRLWLVSAQTSPWLEDCQKYISRKSKIKCFNYNCKFRADESEELFEHVRENHKISGTTFRCSQCDFSLRDSKEWDGILNHIKQHLDTSFYICDACSSYHNSRRRLSKHIRENHAARDVPVLSLTKMGQNIYLQVTIVFANEHLSFSTLRNCFCCEERGLKSDALVMHLKRYHKLVLNYFCEWCNLPIESLQSAGDHYKQLHTKNKLKIRCDLASKSEVSVVSLCNLKIHIDQDAIKNPLLEIKPEPINDDSVILLEDDDIVAENYVKDREKIENQLEKPKLKCIAMSNLLNPTAERPSLSATNQAVNQDVCARPRISIVLSRQASVDSIDSVSCPNWRISQPQVALPSTTTSSVTSGISQQQMTLTSHKNMRPSTSNSIDGQQYSNASIGAGPSLLQRLQNMGSNNAHPQVSASLLSVQDNAQFSRTPHVTTTFPPYPSIGVLTSGVTNGTMTNNISHNPVGAGTSGTVLLPTAHAQSGRPMYSHRYVSVPASNINKPANNIHAAHDVAASSSSGVTDSNPNNLNSNQYRTPSSNAAAAPTSNTIMPNEFSIYSAPAVQNTNMFSASPTVHAHNQQPAIATFASTANQYTISPSSRTKNATNNISQRLPHQNYGYSNPQVVASTSNIDRPSQNPHMFSVSPTVVPPHYPQYTQAQPSGPVVMPRPPYNNNANTAQPINNAYTQVMYASTTVATCILNNPMNEMANPPQNLYSPSTRDGQSNLQQHFPAPPTMVGMMHQPQQLPAPAPATTSGAWNDQLHISEPSVMYRMSNFRPPLNTPAMSSGSYNHTQHLTAPPSSVRGTTNSTQRFPTPSTVNAIINPLQHFRAPPTVDGMTTFGQHFTSNTLTANGTVPTTIRGVPNHQQNCATQSTPNGITDYRSHIAPSTMISGATNHIYPAPVQATSRGVINYAPAASTMRELANLQSNQHMAVPSTISGTTNHTGMTNNTQHITGLSTPSSSTLSSNNFYAPAATATHYEYIHAPRESTATEFCNVGSTFARSHTNATT